MPGETPSTPGGTPVPSPDSASPQPTPGGETPTWDEWLTQQPDTVKALITAHTTGLKGALSSERTSRNNLERQLKELQSKLEKGSEAAQEVERIRADLAEKDAELAFYDQAHSAGARNLKRVYTLAKAEGLVDDRGRYDMDKIKAAFPEYFQTATPSQPLTPKGNAGSGVGAPPPAQGGNAAVNNFIRRAAGIQ